MQIDVENGDGLLSRIFFICWLMYHFYETTIQQQKRTYIEWLIEFKEEESFSGGIFEIGTNYGYN